MNLSEINQELSKAAAEMQTNHDPYAGVLSLTAALELILRYLEEQENAHR